MKRDFRRPGEGSRPNSRISNAGRPAGREPNQTSWLPGRLKRSTSAVQTGRDSRRRRGVVLKSTPREEEVLKSSQIRIYSTCRSLKGWRFRKWERKAQEPRGVGSRYVPMATSYTSPICRREIMLKSRKDYFFLDTHNGRFILSAKYVTKTKGGEKSIERTRYAPFDRVL